MFKPCKFINGAICPHTDGIHCGMAKKATAEQNKIEKLKECPKKKKSNKK